MLRQYTSRPTEFAVDEAPVASNTLEATSSATSVDTTFSPATATSRPARSAAVAAAPRPATSSYRRVRRGGGGPGAGNVVVPGVQLARERAARLRPGHQPAVEPVHHRILRIGIDAGEEPGVLPGQGQFPGRGQRALGNGQVDVAEEQL